MMLVFLLSRAAFPASSRISAARYSSTAARYTGAPAPIRLAYCRASRCLKAQQAIICSYLATGTIPCSAQMLHSNFALTPNCTSAPAAAKADGGSLHAPCPSSGSGQCGPQGTADRPWKTWRRPSWRSFPFRVQTWLLWLLLTLVRLERWLARSVSCVADGNVSLLLDAAFDILLSN